MFGTGQQSRRALKEGRIFNVGSGVWPQPSLIVFWFYSCISLFSFLFYYIFFLRLASFCSDFTISKIETCNWIKESLWKIREAINEVGACSLGLWAGILRRPQKYLIWFKYDIKKRRERYLINNLLQLGLRRYLSTK